MRLAAEATGARFAALWRERDGQLRLAGSHGVDEPPGDAAEAAASILRSGAPASLAVTHDTAVATLRLGQPALGILQLTFPAGAAPDDEALARLTTFAARRAGAPGR